MQQWTRYELPMEELPMEEAGDLKGGHIAWAVFSDVAAER